MRVLLQPPIYLSYLFQFNDDILQNYSRHCVLSRVQFASKQQWRRKKSFVWNGTTTAPTWRSLSGSWGRTKCSSISPSHATTLRFILVYYLIYRRIYHIYSVCICITQVVVFEMCINTSQQCTSMLLRCNCTCSYTYVLLLLCIVYVYVSRR